MLLCREKLFLQSYKQNNWFDKYCISISIAPSKPQLNQGSVKPFLHYISSEEKKKEREKKEKDMKSLNVSLPSSGVSNPWRFSEWDSAQSMRKYTKYQNKSQEKKKKERKLEERFYCTITVALVWVYLNFSELSRAAVLAPAAQFRHSAAALQSKVCSRRCDLLQKVRN